MRLSDNGEALGKNNCQILSFTFSRLLFSCKAISVCVRRYRRIYWSDCSEPATIQTARAVDGGDRQILITDNQHSCIVDIAIDFDSKLISLSHT